MVPELPPLTNSHRRTLRLGRIVLSPFNPFHDTVAIPKPSGTLHSSHHRASIAANVGSKALGSSVSSGANEKSKGSRGSG